MIIGDGLQFWRMLRYMGRPLALLAAWDVAVVLAFKLLGLGWVGLPHIPLALLGSIIGVILSFRNNSSYARWWEGRTLWGSVVNNTRSFARQALTTFRSASLAEAGEVQTMQRRLVYHQIAYAHALRQHLRGLPALDLLSPFLSPDELAALHGQRNIPLALQKQTGELLRTCLHRGWITDMQWHALDISLNDLADAQGGAERIRNTPMPRQYDVFPQLFTQVYCLLLPLGFVQDMGWYTPLGSTLVGFIFLALDKIGRELEEPFSNTINDVPITSITTTIETNLRQLLDEQQLPDPPRPDHGVLW